MDEYFNDLIIRIGEKNTILNALEADNSRRLKHTFRITCELDGLLYEFYKSIIYYRYERRKAK